MNKEHLLFIGILLLAAVILSGQVFAINIPEQAKVGEEVTVSYIPEHDHAYAADVLVTGPDNELILEEHFISPTATTRKWSFTPWTKGTYTAKVTASFKGDILEQKIQEIEVGS